MLETIEKLRRHVRILVDLGRIAGQNSDIDRFLDQAVVQVARAVEVDHAKILRYRRSTADLLMVAGIGWKNGVVRAATFPTDLKSPPGLAYQTAEPVCISDTATARGFVISPILQEHDIVSLANVPVLIDGAAWGVLEIDSSVARDFTEDTTDFLTAAAAIIGATVQRRTAGDIDAAAMAEAAASVQQREILLRELQHRVKNNFQIILSSIGIQKRRFDDAAINRALDHVANRINAIALAHDQLAIRQNVHVVNVASYLRALVTSIEQQVDGMVIDFEADETELSIDRAVPLGLILNEVVTNSIKHAFDEAGGRISITLQTGVGIGEGKLTISDNGSGIKKSNTDGSGLKLIDALARQIGGKVHRESIAVGTSTSIVFPLIS